MGQSDDPPVHPAVDRWSGPSRAGVGAGAEDWGIGMKRITGIIFRAGFDDESRVTGETRRRDNGMTRKQLEVAADFWGLHIEAMKCGLGSLHGKAKKRYMMLEIERREIK